VKAIKYGSPDSLELKDIDKPVVGDEVLVRVHAAGCGRAALGA
jgi:NADPH:quinone reductase-like Zn-dependent oxidoreductase